MKIKDNSALTLKKSGLISFILFALLAVLRVYQSFALTDGKTGFFTEHNFSVSLMYIFAAAAVLVTLGLFYVSGNLPSGDLKKKPSLLYVLSSVFFGFSLIWDGVKSIKAFLGTEGGFIAQTEAVGGNVGLVSMIFALLGGISILLSLMIYIKSGSLTGKLKLPLLFPVIWAFTECLAFFSITVSYVKVAQLLLSIFSAAFLMVFLFENARVLTGIGRKESLRFFFAAGCICAGLSLAAGVPNMLTALFAPENAVSYTPFELYTVAGGLYALASILSRDGETAAEAETADGTEDSIGESDCGNNELTES